MSLAEFVDAVHHAVLGKLIDGRFQSVASPSLFVLQKPPAASSLSDEGDCTQANADEHP